MQKFYLKELKIELTDACNLCCKHCSSLAKKFSTKEISINKAKIIIEEAIKMGVEEIKFSGGEPLLWEGIEELINILKKHNIKSCIYTTGNIELFDEKIEMLKNIGLSRVIFSLFSSDRKQHEYVTKTKGSYNQTISAIEKCVSLDISTEIHFVPLVSNYNELPKIAWLGKKIGVRNISVLRLVPQGRASKHKNDFLSMEQNIELREMIINLRKQGYNIRVGSPYNFLGLEDSKPCNSGTEELTIRPDLTICPCDAFKGVTPEDLGIKDEYYSLKNNSLEECWEKSNYLNEIRKFSTNKNYKQCSECQYCNCGCLGQKFYSAGYLNFSSDPMCLNFQ